MQSTRLIIGLLLTAVSGLSVAGDFCRASSAVNLDQWFGDMPARMGVRIRAKAILVTDAKEYTVVFGTEGGHVAFTTSDERTMEYRKHVPKRDVPAALLDMNEKLVRASRELPGLSPPEIRFYRQEVLLCGRVEMIDGQYSLAVDDLIVAKSYLLLPVGRKAGVREFNDAAVKEAMRDWS